jgi:hypothetical protein
MFLEWVCNFLFVRRESLIFRDHIIIEGGHPGLGTLMYGTSRFKVVV